MRQNLYGYLLDALEPEEREQVEASLNEDEGLKQEIELLRRGLVLLAYDKAPIEAPEGLAERACQHVAGHAHSVTPRSMMHEPPAWRPRGWSMQDLFVAAGIVIAASLLFFPAVNQSRFQARIAGCQNNLRLIGNSLTNYSQQHGNFFPDVPQTGNLASAGVFAPKLIDCGYLDCPKSFVCPSSELAENGELKIPTCYELADATPAQLEKLKHLLSGSYGYSLGYEVDGKYHAPQNLHRATHALVSDTPNQQSKGYQSTNHGGYGQNVWFEDGHVQFLEDGMVPGELRDNIFLNDDGEVGPGLHLNDAVIGTSASTPRLRTVSN